MERQEFDTALEADERGRVRVRMPFDPSAIWGKRQRHYIRGTLNGAEFEGSLGSRGGAWFFPVNKALQQKAGIGPGDDVHVVVEPGESPAAGPPDDLAKALAGEPRAKEFFDGLSGFYQRQYVGWIEGAKKADTRAARVAEVIELLNQGRKQR